MSEKDTATFTVEITSPHGKHAIEQFRHFLGKVANEARERWGIEIEINRQPEGQDYDTEFEE